MKLITRLAVLSTGLFLGCPEIVSAQHMNAVDGPCRSYATTSNLAQCLDRASRKADAELNKTYGTILKFLSVEERESLVNAQRMWLRYRDASCAAERGLYGGGTGSGPAFLACIEAETRHQTAELRAAYWWRVEKSSN